MPGEVTGGSIRSNDGGGGRQNLLGSPDYNGNRIYDAVPLDHHVDAISGADMNAQDLEVFDRLDRAFERGRYDIRNMSDEALEAKIKALEAEINEIGSEIHLDEAHSHTFSADKRDLFERHNRILMDRKWKMQVFLEERLRRNPLPPRPTLKPLPKTPSNAPFRFPDIFGHNPHQPPADIHNSDDIHGPHWKFYPNERYDFTRWPSE